MEKFEISVAIDNQNQHFEVRDYMHHEDDKCKYEIFQDGTFIVSLEPDNHKELHVCKDAGVVPLSTLHLIADQLEGYHL